MLGRHLISQVTFLAPKPPCWQGLTMYPRLAVDYFDPPASIFQALRIQAHATISSFHLIYATVLLTSVGCHYCKSDRFVIYLEYISISTFMFSQIVGFLVHIFFFRIQLSFHLQCLNVYFIKDQSTTNWISLPHIFQLSFS